VIACDVFMFSQMNLIALSGLLLLRLRTKTSNHHTKKTLEFRAWRPTASLI
jgi:hypothetical protein